METISEPAGQDAGFLPRFLARSFDILAGETIVMIIYFIAMCPMEMNFKAIKGELLVALLIVLSFPLSLALDAMIYGLASNTLGKALLGLEVVTSDGKPLTFIQYLKRNLLLWMHGLAFGLPIIHFFAMLWQAIRIGNGRPATYDEPYGYRICKRPLRPVWVGMFILLSILIAFVFMFISINAIINIAFSNKLGKLF